MSDDYSRQLLEEAERLRKDETERKARKKKREPKPKRRRQTGRNERFRTWLRIAIVADLRIFIPLFSLGVVYITLLIINAENTFMGYGDLHAIFLSLGAATIIFLIGNYFVFHGWRNRLPFELHGWNELVDGDDFSQAYWQHVDLQIETRGTMDEAHQKLLDAALYILCQKANGKFYSTDFSDSRNKWKAEGLKASGSANPNVARCIYQFCSGILTKLQKEKQIIATVKLNTRGAQFYVSIPSAD